MRALVLSLATVGMLAWATPSVASDVVPDTNSTEQVTDFSSQTRVVIRDGRRRWHRHHHHGCRVVVVKRWDHGRRVVKRTRICR